MCDTFGHILWKFQIVYESIEENILRKLLQFHPLQGNLLATYENLVKIACISRAKGNQSIILLKSWNALSLRDLCVKKHSSENKLSRKLRRPPPFSTPKEGVYKHFFNFSFTDVYVILFEKYTTAQFQNPSILL